MPSDLNRATIETETQIPSDGANAVAAMIPCSARICLQWRSIREDEFVWGPASDGKFSIKSATWFQCNQNVHPKANLLNKIWKLNLPPKAKIFAWLLVRDRLKTRARLSRFSSNINPVCGLCNNDMETSDHIFRSCLKVWDVWSISNLNHNPTTFNCFDDWIVSINVPECSN